MRRTLLALLAAATVLAGCVNVPAAVEDGPAPMGAVGALTLPGGVELHNGGSRGGLSYLHHADGADVTVTFPEHVLVLGEDGRLLPPEGPLTLQRDALLTYLAPYGASTIRVTIAEATGAASEIDLQLADAPGIVSGDLAVELMKIQRDQFPHKTPGHENYGKALAYFGAEMEKLGYDIELSEYPDLFQLPVSSGEGPASLSSVVGYKRGSATPERYLVFGGHFDVVEETTEGAYDNTAGAIATLALATAMANVTLDHTIVFAMWGGEEDGILGSQAWISAHPDLVPLIDGYWNFDVTPLAWPAPANDPAPIVVATGPDGVSQDTLAAAHQTIVKDWMALAEAEFVYEGVAQGQATGAGVNAQSDHTPFMSRGIPVYFPFTGRVADVFGIIHSETDTIENMTKYALKGPEGIDAEFTPEEMLAGEAVLADSFETQMVAAFYWAILTDAEILPIARVGPPVALGAPTL